MTPARAFAVFCDDIREETGRKASYMGVYGGESVRVGVAPLTMPRLAIAVHLEFDRREDLEPAQVHFDFPGYPPGDSLIVTIQPLDERPFPQVPTAPVLLGKLLLVPFHLRQEGTIIVRGVTQSGVEFPIGQHTIKLLPPPPGAQPSTSTITVF